jgi:hypothetical protein
MRTGPAVEVGMGRRLLAAWIIATGLILGVMPAASAQQMPAYPAPPAAPYYPVPPAAAVVPPPPATPETAQIAECLCRHRSLDALGAAMQARRQAYEASKAEIGQLDAQMQRERAMMDINNQAAVAQFRQLLARRDTAYRRSSGPLASELASVVAQYNAAANDYNASCSNRPWSPILLNQVQATLTCPAP